MKKPPEALKGRGAVSSPEGRFQKSVRFEVDDGWSREGEDPPPRLVTTVTPEIAKSIISRNQSPDISFGQSINPYRGCEHGCIYCFARPSHAYVDLSPGLDFESKLFFKKNAAEILEKELRHPRYRCETIVLGSNTDPYQPIERAYRVTRQLLEVMNRFNQPVSIVTKGAALLERDLDILTDMAGRGLARVAISVTSLNDDVKRTLEPRTSSAKTRLGLIRKCSEAGIPVMVMVAPIIPVITDPEMERILEASREAGALAAGYVMLRLPWELQTLFQEWLQAHHPLKVNHVMSLMKQLHGGAPQGSSPQMDGRPLDEVAQEIYEEPSPDMPSPYRKNPYYNSDWGRRQRGEGPFAALVEARFRAAVRRLGFAQRESIRINTAAFAVPPASGDQLSMFDS